MNQKSTTKPKDTICSRCHSEDHVFLHNFWDGKKGYKMCTSCVLQSQKLYYCPTCFVVHKRFMKEWRIGCNKCPSRSHVRCFPNKESSSGMCLSCLNPEILEFCLKKKKLEGEDGYCKVVDMKAAVLLLTAAKIAKDSIASAYDASEESAWEHVMLANKEKKRVTKFVETYAGPPLRDTESGKLVTSSIKGATDV